MAGTLAVQGIATPVPLMLITARFGVHFGKRLDKLVLAVWQVEAFAVSVLAVLMIALVQTTEEQHHIGIAGHTQSLVAKLLGRTRVVEVLTGHHTVVFAGGITYIAAGINYFSLVAHALFESVERSDLITGLQRRRTAAHCHHLYCVFTYHEDVGSPFGAEWEHTAFVAQEHDAVGSYRACGIVVRLAA